MSESVAFTRFLRLAVTGASHAAEMRFSLENFPKGFALNASALANFMARRAPGRDALSTARRETDAVWWRAGFSPKWVTTGETIVGAIESHDQRPYDYGAARTIARPGHADFGQWVEMGRIPTGGGKNSGRLTAPLCAAGGLCLQYLASRGISVAATIETIGEAKTPRQQEAVIRRAQRAGDSVGGTVRCRVTGLRPGLGGAMFDGLESALSAALFAIPGVKALGFGSGFAAASAYGSDYNDTLKVSNGQVTVATNRQGGLWGGRTNGAPLEFTVAFRPTPTIFKPKASVDLATMRKAICAMKGRHDPCIVRRATPVVEALAAFVVTDALLAEEAARPRICLTLTGRTLAEDLAQFASERYFVDCVELRADLLKEDERERAAEFPALLASEASWRVPVILTCRRQADGGAYVRSERDRTAYFKRILEAGNFAYVDFESDFRVPALRRLAAAKGTRIIRSIHDFTGAIENVPSVCRSLVGETDEIAKVAFLPQTLADVARLFEETRHFTDTPHIVLAMGPLGFPSRVLAARTHSLLTYASVEGLTELGHIRASELVRTYRFRSVTREAKLLGVTGYPLSATRSPEINNAAFADEDCDAVMVSYPSRSIREGFAFARALNFVGLAVTIPHKRAILSELDQVDPAAAEVGAVNTVVWREGVSYGYNTDVEGFAHALRAFVGNLKGRRAAVLGDGGAAAAVKVALRREGVAFEVFHRQTPPKGFDILINATPVDPIPEYVFTGREWVYDLVYVPSVTPLMARAAAAGCRTQNGFSMLCAQAAAQRRLYQL